MTPPKVLIIDDSEAIRRSVVDTLTPAGFEVLTATDGFRGIATLRETLDLCLVIIDLNMPGISGFGVLDWMRKEALPHLPPAVFMTTEVTPSVVEQARKGGALGWLVKPARPDQLLAVAKRVLEKRQASGG